MGSGVDHRFLAQSHAAQLALCADLERIADSLPHAVNRQLCHTVAQNIRPLMVRATALEQQFLGAELKRCAPGDDEGLGATLRRLIRESHEDLGYADEVQELLGAFGAGSCTVSCDALGYVLRGFFEARKRRIALEGELLASLADSVELPKLACAL